MPLAARRRAWLLIATLWPLAAASGNPARIHADGFEIRSEIEVNTPEIVVQPGEAGQFCYYFRAPLGSTRGVQRWSSTLRDQVHHVVLYTTHDTAWIPDEQQPPGTLTAGTCGQAGSEGLLGWQYAAHNPTQQLLIPDDDGTGQPLAMELVANQPMVLALYIPNPTPEPIIGSATIRANLLPPDELYTRTATYVTFNAELAIPPSSSGSTASQTCPVPASVKFWHVSTRTHQRGTLSEVRDQATTLVSVTNWENPAATVFDPPAFYTFSPGGLTYRCEYNNPDNFVVRSGDDQFNDEVCMGIGYFFPATRPAVCLNAIGPL